MLLIIVLFVIILTSGCIIYGEYSVSGPDNLLHAGDKTICLNMASGAKVELNLETISTSPLKNWPSSSVITNEIRLNEAIVQNCTGW
jgi:hypothetical protein